MPPIKMQSYAAIKHEALTTFEVDCLLAELQRRDLLCYEFVGEGLEQHLMWKGSMDSGNPAHPRSTSVKVCGWMCVLCWAGHCLGGRGTGGGSLLIYIPLHLQLLWHQSLEFNPLRLSVVARWLKEHGAGNTSELALHPGLNANAAVHDDSTCRPVYDTESGRLLQRCVSCAHLGTNTENARMSLALQRRRVDQMARFITESLEGPPGGGFDNQHQQALPEGTMSSELMQRFKVVHESLRARKRARLSDTVQPHWFGRGAAMAAAEPLPQAARDHDQEDPPHPEDHACPSASPSS